MALTTSANELRFDPAARLLAPDGCGCGTADESTAGSSCSAERSGSACHACANNSWKHAAAAASAQPGCPLLPQYNMSQQRTTRLRGDGSTAEAACAAVPTGDKASWAKCTREPLRCRTASCVYCRRAPGRTRGGPRRTASSMACVNAVHHVATRRGAQHVPAPPYVAPSTHRRKPAHDRSRASHHADAAHDISRRTSSVAQMMSWS